MPASSKGKGCVSQEMRRWKEGNLHSGRGKGGKEGPVVKDKKQAIAIALSVCGKPSDYYEKLTALGFSEETARKASQMMYDNPDWVNQFQKGDTLSQLPREEKITIAPSFPGFDIDNRPGKQRGSQGKNKTVPSQGIYPVTIPKGNPQQGPRSRSDLTGMAAFSQESNLVGQCNQKEKKEKAQQNRTPEQQEADSKRSSEMAGKPVAPNADKKAAAQKAAETRKRCKKGGGSGSKTPTTNSAGAGNGITSSSSSSSSSRGAGPGAAG